MKRKSNNKNALNAAASSAANEATKNLADVTDQVFSDANALGRVLDQYRNCLPSTIRGRAFEFLEVLKFNKDAVINGSCLRAEPTHNFHPTSPADINIKAGEEIVKTVQAKSSTTAAFSLRYQANEKYDGMDRLIHKEHIGEAKSLIDKHIQHRGGNSAKYEDVKNNLTGNLNHQDITSEGTSLQEASEAALEPDVAVRSLKATAVVEEIAETAITGALIGGGFAFAYKSVTEGYAVYKGRKNLSEAVTHTLITTLSASAKSAVISGGARAVAVAARAAGAKSFAATSAPSAIAVTAYELAANTIKLASGKITPDDFIYESGGALIRGTATFYYGLAGQMLIPIPILGGAVGSMVGYLASNILYQSGLLAGKHCIVASARADRLKVESICSAAIDRMEAYRTELLEFQERFENAFKNDIMTPLISLEESLANQNYQMAMEYLQGLASAMNSSLPFKTFEEFDQFMRSPSTQLII